MEVEPLTAKPVRFPPGRVAVRLNEGHRRAYRALHARYQTVLQELPLLRDRDFEGRPVILTHRQFEALRRAFAGLAAEATRRPGVAFEGQEREKSQLFKRLQYLS